MPAEALWKGVTSVSKAGKQRGRGKGAGKRIAKDLNKGQVIGVGRINMVWPGLNAPVIKGKETLTQKKLPPNKDYLTNLLRVRNEMDTFTKVRQHSLERGWAGTTMPGKWFGAPDPVHDEMFEGFDSKVLQLKNQFCMKGGSGRTRSVKAMIVAGNKNGLAGFAVGKAREGRAALKKAKNKAAQRLRYIELDGQTVVHDFYSRYGATAVYVYKKPPGYGIVAHRCIKAICEVVGIKDIYVKVDNKPEHYLHVTKAFFAGLCAQKSFQQLADEKRLHVVEFKPENDYYPTVRASPSDRRVRTVQEINPDEVTDFRMYINDGKVTEFVEHEPPHWTKYEGFLKALYKWHWSKARQKVRVQLRARYGQLDSFLTIREREERAKRKAQLALDTSDQKETAST